VIYASSRDGWHTPQQQQIRMKTTTASEQFWLLPVALKGVPVTSSLGARENGSADSRAFFTVIPAKMLKIEESVPPLIPPVVSECIIDFCC
jgi:hypothetical protein